MEREQAVKKYKAATNYCAKNELAPADDLKEYIEDQIAEKGIKGDYQAIYDLINKTVRALRKVRITRTMEKNFSAKDLLEGGNGRVAEGYGSCQVGGEEFVSTASVVAKYQKGIQLVLSMEAGQVINDFGRYMSMTYHFRSPDYLIVTRTESPNMNRYRG